MPKRDPDLLDRIVAATAAEANGFHDRRCFEGAIVKLSRLSRLQWAAVTPELIGYCFFRAGLRVAEEMLRDENSTFPEALFRQELALIRSCAFSARRDAERAQSVSSTDAT
jgi:hypothetical protein